MIWVQHILLMTEKIGAMLPGGGTQSHGFFSPYAKRGLGRLRTPQTPYSPRGAGYARAAWGIEVVLEGLQPSKPSAFRHRRKAR
jgi:hypothetical protein